MLNPDTSISHITQHRVTLSRLTANGVSSLAPDHSRQVLQTYLDYFGAQLSRNSASRDIGLLQEMLLEVAHIVRSGTADILTDDYENILERLVAIYARGLNQRGQNAFMITAADYADVIEAISQEYPAYDYSEAVGQLLWYMSRLFGRRKSSWKTVYEHILSMPDSVAAKQLLMQAYFLEINEWVESGVDNLFEIRSDLYAKKAALLKEETTISREIEKMEQALKARQGKGTARDRNVVDLGEKRKERTIETLRREMQEIISEKEGKETMIAMIESDIRQFEDKLKEAKRAYFIRLV
ncbi:MAG: hypothetical protein U9Q81_11510 [Pseudomonadota bacterium]|nr:hypothetical protein [Pseudomonadota bacterium]